MPNIVEIKKKIYHEITEQINIKPHGEYLFRSLNVVDKKEWENLGRTYFSNNKSKIVIINEGLLSFLSIKEKLSLGENLALFLKNIHLRDYG